MRRLLKRAGITILVLALVLAGAGGGAFWWVIYRPLPDLEGNHPLRELKQEAVVDRDARGVPHIRAGSEDDLFAAQGYVMAQDRLWQMDVLRRLAGGELAEIFGPVAIERDKEYRTLGLHLAAARDAELLDAEVRQSLEAYARGVNRYIEERRDRLPWEFRALDYEPRPWRPADSLLIAGYMYKTLTSTWETELKRAEVLEKVGPNRAKDLYVVDSPHNHFIVGDAAVQKHEEKPGARPVPQRLGKPAARDNLGSLTRSETTAPAGSGIADPLFEQVHALEREGIGSNNWVVDGRYTASGKPLLANDTHLPLGVPGIWYMVHLTAPGWNVRGFALSGAPGVIIGHNDRIAWGFTNNGADVQDLYIETFHPENPKQYLVGGNYVEAQVRAERIRVRGQSDHVFEVAVTRHGPIVQREGGKAYALRWTATEPGKLGASYSYIGRAQNWAEFLEAMRHVPGPAQNAVYADVDGNIGFVVAADIPIRKSGDGSVPVAGDTDDYEWTGYIPFAELPQALNPPSGKIATANARVVGPGYPHYLTDRWASPYRTDRIYERLDEKKKFTPEDFLAMQMDVVSTPHRWLAQHLIRAAQSVKPKDVTRDFLALVENWDGSAWGDSVRTSFVEYARQALLRRVLRPYLGDETSLYEWRSPVFLEKLLAERPAAWLPGDTPTYEALLVACADDAAERLTTMGEQQGLDSGRWGRINALEMRHPLAQSPWLRPVARWLNIGPMGQSGTAHTVKAAQPSHGAAMRYVAVLSNWDKSLMNLPLGQSGQVGSRHFRDQFEAWFEGSSFPSPFGEAALEQSRTHRLRLTPGNQ